MPRRVVVGKDYLLEQVVTCLLGLGSVEEPKGYTVRTGSADLVYVQV